MTSTDARPRILARREDLHSVIYHLLVLACYALAFCIYQNPTLAGIDGPWSMAAFVGAAAWLLGWICGVDVGVNFHNHTHRRVFRRAWMNRWFGRFWTFSGGWPAFYWQYSHVVVHHGNLLGAKDWTLPRRDANGVFENYYKYTLLHWPFRSTIHLLSDWRRGKKRFRSRMVTELLIFAALYSIPFWIDPVMALWLWVLPHWIGNQVMGAGMYSQHVGCVKSTPSNRVRHSNTFLNEFFNATMFNIGYHCAHHDYPNVHWADLPNFHESHKDELREGGAHVVPVGYYGAGHILKSRTDPHGARERFRNIALAEFSQPLNEDEHDSLGDERISERA